MSDIKLFRIASDKVSDLRLPRHLHAPSQRVNTLLSVRNAEDILVA